MKMSSDGLGYLRAAIAAVMLERGREWTVQGFGFMRTYLPGPRGPKEFRLNVWHSALRVPEVSTIHDHPWDLSSTILAGHLVNQRFVELPDENNNGLTGEDWNADNAERLTILTYEPIALEYQTLRTGVGGGLVPGTRKSTTLYGKPFELYMPGEAYSQLATEVHETSYIDGTVTINRRAGDTEYARVFWPKGGEWVDAIPREATTDEVADYVYPAAQDLRS